MSFARAIELVAAAHRIVALTGAGISTPSGIPDFRSPRAGLWEQEDPMVVASCWGFVLAPERFYGWFAPLLQRLLQARPNPAHTALAQLEQLGRLHAVATQNIDGLHQAAGSRNVFELHGHLRSATCLQCAQAADAQPLLPQILTGAVPRCACGGLLKPDIVLFGDPLPEELFIQAEQAIAACDLLLVAGSSLEVRPVCELPYAALRRSGGAPAHVIVVNYGETWLDAEADVVLREDVAVALPALAAAAAHL